MFKAKTPAEARQGFIERGETIQEWSRKNNFAPCIVYELLRGKLKGNFGETHRAAVLLGLKKGADK